MRDGLDYKNTNEKLKKEKRRRYILDEDLNKAPRQFEDTFAETGKLLEGALGEVKVTKVAVFRWAHVNYLM